MAIQATLTKINNFGQETVLSDLYIAVVSAHCTKTEIQAAVTAYAAAGGTSLFTDNYSCALDLEGPNPIKQAYLHLKSLPEFSDAVDC